MNEPKTGAHHTSPASWTEWKEKCAIDLCSQETGDDLIAFAAPPIKKIFHRYSALSSLPEEETKKNKFCWHLFECYMHERSSNTQRPWKNWLFERTLDRPDISPRVALESSSRHCFKTATNAHLVREGILRTSPIDKLSTSFPSTSEPDSPLAQSAEIPSKEKRKELAEAEKKLSPDPAQIAEIKEIRKLGSALADKMMKTMKHHEKVAVLADSLDIALNNSTVLSAAKKSASTLYSSLHSSPDPAFSQKYSKLAARAIELQKDLAPTPDTQTSRLLVASTILALQKKIYSWAKSEKSLSSLLSLGEPTLHQP